MGCNLPIHHAVSLSIWRNTICSTIVPKDRHTNSYLSSLGSVCWSAVCGLHYLSHFSGKEITSRNMSNTLSQRSLRFRDSYHEEIGVSIK